MLHGKRFHLFQVVNGNTMNQRQVRVVDSAEIGVSGKRSGDIKGNGKQDY
jgi:hypothetical protein